MNIVTNKEALKRCGFMLECVFMHGQTLLQEWVKRKVCSPEIHHQDSWELITSFEKLALICHWLTDRQWFSLVNTWKQLPSAAYLGFRYIYIGAHTHTIDAEVFKVMQMQWQCQGQAENAQEIWEIPKENQFSKSIQNVSVPLLYSHHVQQTIDTFFTASFAISNGSSDTGEGRRMDGRKGGREKKKM